MMAPSHAPTLHSLAQMDLVAPMAQTPDSGGVDGRLLFAPCKARHTPGNMAHCLDHSSRSQEQSCMQPCNSSPCPMVTLYPLLTVSMFTRVSAEESFGRIHPIKTCGQGSGQRWTAARGPFSSTGAHHMSLRVLCAKAFKLHGRHLPMSWQILLQSVGPNMGRYRSLMPDAYSGLILVPESYTVDW